MRKIGMLVITLCSLQVSLAENLPISYLLKDKSDALKPKTNSIIVSNLSSQRKVKLKQRIVLKRIDRKIDEISKKKQINTLGWMSFIGSILGMIVFPFGWMIFAFAIVGLSLSFLSIIFGILSLTKRSKLKDKSGTRRWPGLLGIIIGSGFLIAIAIWIFIALTL